MGSPKRLDLIVESLDAFARGKNETIEFHIVGNGPLLDIALSRTYSPNLKMIAHGFMEKVDIASLLSNTDVFLHASDIETFSIVTAEALAVGTPVLASNVGALPELVTSESGLLVNNGLQEWVDGIRTILQMKFNRQNIAEQCYMRFNEDVVAKQIMEIYQLVQKDQNT